MYTKLSLRTQIVLLYAVLMLAGNGSLIFVTAHAQKNMRLEEARHNLENQVSIASNALEIDFQNNDYTHIAEIVPPYPHHLIVWNATGNPLYDSSDELASIAQLDFSPQTHKPINLPINPKHISVITAVEHDGRIYGWVQLSEPSSRIWNRIYLDWASLVGAALFINLVMSMVSLGFANALRAQLRTIQQVTRQIANSDLNGRVPLFSTSELQQIALDFNHMADRLQQLVEQNKTFVANAAHELRTPLTNIRLRADSLLEGAIEDPSLSRKFVQDIVNETLRLSDIVTDALTLSRLDANLALSRFIASDLNNLWEDFLNTFEPYRNAKPVSIHFMPQKGLPFVLLDTDQMTQVFYNLLDNALKFTPAGSITIHTQQQDLWVYFSIQDTGIGIPEKDLPHVFERFYRSHKGGTGLGLSIVEGIVRMHQGKITISSEEGQGTTISIYFPALPNP